MSRNVGVSSVTQLGTSWLKYLLPSSVFSLGSRHPCQCVFKAAFKLPDLELLLQISSLGKPMKTIGVEMYAVALSVAVIKYPWEKRKGKDLFGLKLQVRVHCGFDDKPQI